MQLWASNAIRDDLVRQVDAQLTALVGELDVSQNPHRMALRYLGIDGMGWTKQPYSDESFRIWSDLAQRDGNDFETLHHLAIMHHARAFDHEMNNNPAKADEDWEAALSNWHRLWQADAFWNRLAAMACKNTKRDAVDQLREEFPALVLRVHYDIAFDPDTRHHRAKYHVKLVQESPFPGQSLATVRRETYLRFVDTVPPNVWQMNMLDPEVIKLGTDRIQEFLAIDPECSAALEDMLRLQVRLLRARYQDLQAMGEESPQRGSLLRTLKEAADDWRPYLDRLVPTAHEAEEEIRQKLCLWYRVMGEVHCALDLEPEAIGYYEQCKSAGQPDDDDYARCVKSLGKTHAYLAREKAHRQAHDARAYCDQVKQMANLPLSAHVMLANAYTLLDEFDVAKEVCECGLSVEPDVTETDYEVIEEFHRDRQRLETMLERVGEARHRYEAHQLLDQATTHMKDDRFAEAIPLLDEAEHLCPEESAVYFLRCQCYLDQDRIDETRKDLEAFRNLSAGSRDDLQQADRLEEQVNRRAELLDEFGVQAIELRGQAIRAFNRESFSEAADILRQALQVCRRNGRRKLNHELANALLNWAGRDVNQVMEDDSRSLSEKKSVCTAARQRLEEASRLNPESREVSANLESLRRLTAQLETHGEAMARAREMEDRYGGPRALELQQKAAQAFNNDQLNDAIKYLREALDASKGYQYPNGAPELKKELSVVLTGAAVTMVNEAGAHGLSSVKTQASAMLLEALQLDPKNEQAQQNLMILAGLDRPRY